MTPADIEELFRLNVDDTDTTDPLWSDLEVYSYLDEAQKQFARMTDYFSDASTPAIVDLTVNRIDKTADPVVIDDTHRFADLDYRVIKIRSAKLVSTGERVKPMTYEAMDREPSSINSTYATIAHTDWEDALGDPKHLITDVERGKVRISPMAVSNTPNPTAGDLLDVIRLQVYRLPLTDLIVGSTAFEIQESEYQRSLILYMKHLAYSKNDVDVFDQALADRALASAEVEFSRIKRHLKRVRYSAHTATVKYGGL